MTTLTAPAPAALDTLVAGTRNTLLVAAINADGDRVRSAVAASVAAWGPLPAYLALYDAAQELVDDLPQVGLPATARAITDLVGDLAGFRGGADLVTGYAFGLETGAHVAHLMPTGPDADHTRHTLALAAICVALLGAHGHYRIGRAYAGGEVTELAGGTPALLRILDGDTGIDVVEHLHLAGYLLDETFDRWGTPAGTLPVLDQQT